MPLRCRPCSRPLRRCRPMPRAPISGRSSASAAAMPQRLRATIPARRCRHPANIHCVLCVSVRGCRHPAGADLHAAVTSRIRFAILSRKIRHADLACPGAIGTCARPSADAVTACGLCAARPHVTGVCNAYPKCACILHAARRPGSLASGCARSVFDQSSNHQRR